MAKAFFLPIILFLALVCAPVQAHEFMPDATAELHFLVRYERSDYSSQAPLGLAVNGQPMGHLFLGGSATYLTGLPKPKDGCETNELHRYWTGQAVWIGPHFPRWRAALRYARNVETIEPFECLGHDVKSGSVSSNAVHDAVTEHPGAMFELRFAPWGRAGALYDHRFQFAGWVTFDLLRLAVRLEAERTAIPHGPFPAYVRTAARLGLRFSPVGARLTRSRFHLLASVGVVHTDFESVDGWSPDRPNAVQVTLQFAGVWR